MEGLRTKRAYRSGKRQKDIQLSDVWFGKAYAELSEDELRSYMRRYKMWRLTGDLGLQEDTSHIRIKKYATGGTTFRQRIRCCCGRVVSTTYSGFELELHKTTNIHRRALGNNPDRSNVSIIDRQWVFTDDDLLEGVRVKRTRTLQDVINELD